MYMYFIFFLLPYLLEIKCNEQNINYIEKIVILFQLGIKVRFAISVFQSQETFSLNYCGEFN